MVTGHPKLVLGAGHFHFSHRVPALIADYMGFFRDEGLENIHFMATGDDGYTLKGLRRGVIHIGMDLSPGPVMQKNSEGEDVYIIGGMLNRQELCLIGARGVESVAGLRGKKIGIAEAKPITLRFIYQLLRRHGLDPEKDVTFQVSGYSSLNNHGPRLDKGEYSAATIAESHLAEARRLGYPLFGGIMDEHPEGYPFRTIVTTGKMLDEFPEKVKACLRSIIRSCRFIAEKKNYAEIIRICDEYPWEKEMGFDSFDRDLFENEQFAFFKGVPKDGSIPLKGLETLIAGEKAVGKLPASYSSEKVLKLKLVREAAQEVDARYGSNGYM